MKLVDRFPDPGAEPPAPGPQPAAAEHTTAWLDWRRRSGVHVAWVNARLEHNIAKLADEIALKRKTPERRLLWALAAQVLSAEKSTDNGQLKAGLLGGVVGLLVGASLKS